MNVKTFIDRPILSGVISVLMVLVGIIGLSQLALEQFPEIAPPTVRIMASYTGANAETVQKSVVVPLEEAINGVEGMMYMTSSASNNGTASIGIFFRQGTDPDMAMVNVQNRAATVQGRLPSDVVKSGLTVRKRQTSNIKQIAVYSPDSTFDRAFLANYTKINIEPRLSRIPGVGEVNVMGADYSMRIWLDPMKMARYGLTPADITQVLNEQNVEVATGTLGAESSNTFQYVLKYRGRYEDEQGYENLVIRSLPDGDVLRIGDIARVELGSQNYNIIAETNGSPGVNVSINQVAGSNANEIIKQIDREVEEIRESLPPGIVIEDLESKKDFLDASITSVVETLLEALALVILVVFLFLQSWRATIIPAIAIMVSLIATLAVIYAIGFSLNMLTLFALVLVIGTVVDDAIVVVEAVQAKLDEGTTDKSLTSHLLPLIMPPSRPCTVSRRHWSRRRWSSWPSSYPSVSSVVSPAPSIRSSVSRWLSPWASRSSTPSPSPLPSAPSLCNATRQKRNRVSTPVSTQASRPSSIATSKPYPPSFHVDG